MSRMHRAQERCRGCDRCSEYGIYMRPGREGEGCVTPQEGDTLLASVAACCQQVWSSWVVRREVGAVQVSTGGLGKLALIKCDAWTG